jgi:ribosomal protein L40E
MQQTTLCTTCGAEITDDARFCRKCGQPSTRFAAESVTEGTTRILETPEAGKVFGQEFYEQHGSLAQPTTRIPPQANQTARNLAVAEPKRQNWALIASLIFVGCALLATILFFALRGSPTTAPSVVKREIPAVPPPPRVPPLPPSIGQGSSAISSEFAYPGAQTEIEIKNGGGGGVLKLRTRDPFDKVVNWYIEKLNPANIIKKPEGNGTKVILNGDGMNTVITDDGPAGVSIVLNQGGD